MTIDYDKTTYYYELKKGCLSFYNSKDSNAPFYHVFPTQEVLDILDIECLAEITLLSYIDGFKASINIAIEINESNCKALSKQLKELKPIQTSS